MKYRLISVALLLALGMFMLTSCFGFKSDNVSELESRIEELEEELEDEKEKSGAGKKSTTNKFVVKNKAEVNDEKIVLTTGGTAGTYYAYCMAMSPILSRETGITFDVVASGGSQANIRAIDSGDANMAIVQGDTMYYAYTGTNLFAGEKIKTFSAVTTLFPECVQIIASKASGIKTVADLEGKRVAVGDAGSGVELNAKQILAASGLDINEDIKKQNLGFSAGTEALKAGTVDAFFCVAGYPTTAIMELAMSRDITVVSVDDEVFAKLSDKYGFYTQQTVPTGTYFGVDEDVKTVAVMTTFIVDNDLSKNTVYEITKALYENKNDICQVHAKGNELNPGTALDGIPSDVPVHPGAEKYYKEKGIM